MATTNIESRKNGADLSKLSDQRRQFCLEMMASENFDQVEAARRAGYKTPHQAAYKLMKVPAIARFLGKELRKREERTQLTSDKIWEYMHRVLFFDPAECYPNAGKGWWVVKSIHEMPLEHRQLIESIDVVMIKVGGEDVPLPVVKFVSRGKTLEMAARHALPPLTQEHNVKAAVAVIGWDELAARGNGRVNSIDARLAEEEQDDSR